MNTPKKFHRLLFLVLLMAIVAAPAIAQSTGATIKGRVTDDSGDPVGSADIVATNVATGFTHIATSRVDGSFVLAGITPGRYTLLVASPAHQQRTEERTILAGQSITLDFRLTPSVVLTEAITVIGDTFVETTHEVATNVTREQIERLPQNNRNFMAFAALAPGVIFQDSEFNRRFTSGAGALSHNHVNVVIDGASFKNDVLQGGVIGQDSSRGNPFPQNAVQEFRVLTQNYSSEFGQATGAVISAVTKSGTNSYRGDAFGFFQDKSMVDARNPLSANPGAKPEYEREQFGASIGGPIVRDKLHFFASYESNNEDRMSEVKFGTLTGAAADAIRAQYADRIGYYGVPFELSLLFGKVSYQPAARHLVDASAYLRDEDDIRFGGGTTAYDVAEQVVQDIWNVATRYQYTATSWLNEAVVNYQSSEWNPRPLNGDEVGFNYVGVIRVGGRDTEQTIGQTRLGFRDDFSYTGLQWHGNHSVKVGTNVNFTEYDVVRRLFGNPLYSFRTAENFEFPYQAQYGVGDPSTSGDNTQIGLFVQDDWSVTPKLAFNIGVRWDYESDMFDTNHVTPQYIRDQVAFLNLPSKYFSDGNDRDPIDDMIAPRFGFTYDLRGDTRSIVFGGWGRYYDRVRYGAVDGEKFRLQYATATFRFSRDGQPRDGQPTAIWDPRYFTIAGLQELMAIGTTGTPEIHLMANDLKAPYSDQWTLGVKQTLGSYVVSASYANQRGHDGLTMIRGNRRPDGTCCLAVPGASGVFLSVNDVQTWYDAYYVKVDRPFARESRWSASLAYTYADARQNGGDGFSLDYPTIADYPIYPTAHVPDHTLVGTALWRLPWNTTVGALLAYNSGTKYNIVDESKGTSADLRRVLRSEGEEDDDTLVDLRIEKVFNIGQFGFGLIGEVFNVFDDRLYNGYSGLIPYNSTNPNFGKPSGVAFGSGRRFQYGVKVQF